MIQIGYEEGQALALTHVCGECGGALLVAWGGGFGVEGYVLRCGRDAQHQGFVKRGNPTRKRLEKMGLSPEEVDNEMETGITVREDKLAQYQTSKALTSAQAREIVNTIWPKAPETEKAKAIMVCAQYQLNPLMKHVFLVPFKDQWALVLGIKAKRLIASRKRPYSYADGPRAMTEAEQKTILGEIDPANLWAITILEDKEKRRYPGYGNWPRAQAPYGSDKGNSKANMAFIRSESNALEKLNPGEMPSLDVMSEEYMPTVDTSTGEILDGGAPPETTASQEGQGVPSGAKADALVTPEAPPASPAAAQAQADPVLAPQGKVMTPTEFWLEARKLGYTDARKVEEVLGAYLPTWLRDGGTYRTALIALQRAQTKAEA